jgi:hypothetical protein
LEGRRYPAEVGEPPGRITQTIINMTQHHDDLDAVLAEYASRANDFDWSALRDECDRRLIGILAHGGPLDRAFAAALNQLCPTTEGAY